MCICWVGGSAVAVAALRLLGGVLAEMARGRAVSVVPLDAEIGTQQAADMLNVSRPFLAGLLENRSRVEPKPLGEPPERAANNLVYALFCCLFTASNHGQTPAITW